MNISQVAFMFALDRVCTEQKMDRPTTLDRDGIAAVIVANNKRLSGPRGDLAVRFPSWLVNQCKTGRGEFAPPWAEYDAHMANPEVESDTLEKRQEATDYQFNVSTRILAERRAKREKRAALAKTSAAFGANVNADIDNDTDDDSDEA